MEKKILNEYFNWISFRLLWTCPLPTVTVIFHTLRRGAHQTPSFQVSIIRKNMETFPHANHPQSLPCPWRSSRDDRAVHMDGGVCSITILLHYFTESCYITLHHIYVILHHIFITLPYIYRVLFFLGCPKND